MSDEYKKMMEQSKKIMENTVMKVPVPNKGVHIKLEPIQLAESLYEGTPHLQNLAETLARNHGKAGALTFFANMGEQVQNFWLTIAQQLINHASEWEENEGSGCCLSDKEMKRLKLLPRHPYFAGSQYEGPI